MLDDWYRTLHIAMTVEQFHALPRNAAYKYEYSDGQAWLKPRPRTFNALLDLKPRPAPNAIEGNGHALTIRPLAAADWVALPRAFASAFEAVPPFSCLNTHDRLEAATASIHQTKSGGDGPVIESTCFVAECDERVVGAILVPLIPRRKEGE